MDKSRLYELSDLLEKELFLTKPDGIESIGIYHIVHNDDVGAMIGERL